MQIDSIASSIASNPQMGTLSALTQVTANGRARAGVVERTEVGYEAYLPDRPGPVASGSSIVMAEDRLNSTIQFQV